MFKKIQRRKNGEGGDFEAQSKALLRAAIRAQPLFPRLVINICAYDNRGNKMLVLNEI